MPLLLPLHVRTEQNGLGNGLSRTQALGVFCQPELALLAPLDSLPVRVLSVYEFLWWKFLPKIKILSEIGKKKYQWKAFLELLLVGSSFLKPGKEIGSHNFKFEVVWTAGANADNRLLSTKLQAEYYKQKLGSQHFGMTNWFKKINTLLTYESWKKRKSNQINGLLHCMIFSSAKSHLPLA